MNWYMGKIQPSVSMCVRVCVCVRVLGKIIPGRDTTIAATTATMVGSFWGCPPKPYVAMVVPGPPRSGSGLPMPTDVQYVSARSGISRAQPKRVV